MFKFERAVAQIRDAQKRKKPCNRHKIRVAFFTHREGDTTLHDVEDARSMLSSILPERVTVDYDVAQAIIVVRNPQTRTRRRKD